MMPACRFVSVEFLSDSVPDSMTQAMPCIILVGPPTLGVLHYMSSLF